MADYNTEIRNSLAVGLLSKTDIFDFETSPYKDEFEGFYTFCRENLDIQSKSITISPNIFLYKNDNRINAKAISCTSYYAVTINSGLFIWAILKLRDNESLNKYLKANYSETVEKFDISPSNLGFQLTTQFTYYHELGHLFQFSKTGTSNSLQERTENQLIIDTVRHHKLEINADSFASIAIASHIQQYLEKIFGNNLNYEKAVLTLKILCSNLLNYLIQFSDTKRDIYFIENSHPHPFFRMFNVILNVLNYLNQSPLLKVKSINIDPKILLSDTIDFYKSLEAAKIYSTDISSLLLKVEEVQYEMVEYLGQMIEFDLDGYNNALELWNKQST